MGRNDQHQHQAQPCNDPVSNLQTNQDLNINVITPRQVCLFDQKLHDLSTLSSIASCPALPFRYHSTVSTVDFGAELELRRESPVAVIITINLPPSDLFHTFPHLALCFHLGQHCTTPNPFGYLAALTPIKPNISRWANPPEPGRSTAPWQPILRVPVPTRRNRPPCE